MQSKLKKIKPQKYFHSWGHAPGAPVLDPPLIRVIILRINKCS